MVFRTLFASYLQTALLFMHSFMYLFIIIFSFSMILISNATSKAIISLFYFRTKSKYANYLKIQFVWGNLPLDFPWYISIQIQVLYKHLQIWFLLNAEIVMLLSIRMIFSKVQCYFSCFFSIRILSMQLFNRILHSFDNVWCHGCKLISVKLGYVVVLHKARLVIQRYSVIIKYRFQLIFQLLYQLLDDEEVFIQLLKCTLRKHYCRMKGGTSLD